ncbi:MAG: 2-phospho-L-lactate transferase CofD family protein [Brevundimonas sp.]
MLNVVVINGGRGAASLIPALLDRQGLSVTSVVNAYDDGKSTGEIRRVFDMLGPSDLRKVQELMLPVDDPHRAASQALFAYRYPVGQDAAVCLADMRRFATGGDTIAGIEIESGAVRSALQRFVGEFVDGLEVIQKARGLTFEFGDCALMNCLYAGAFLACGRDMEVTTRAFDRLFRLRGTVLPNSVENKWLTALRANGEMLYSEAEIVELRSNVRIDGLYLLDGTLDRTAFECLSLDEKKHFLDRHHTAVMASPGVVLALQQADIIIYSAGTQHSSLYPTYMSRGVAETIAANRTALKVFVTNIGADYETPSYLSSDYILGAHRHLCRPDSRDYPMRDLFSAVLINKSRLKADESYVEDDVDRFDDIPVRRIVDAFESEQSPGKHDGSRVTGTILALYDEGGFSR